MLPYLLAELLDQGLPLGVEPRRNGGKEHDWGPHLSPMELIERPSLSNTSKEGSMGTKSIDNLILVPLILAFVLFKPRWYLAFPSKIVTDLLASPQAPLLSPSDVSCCQA
jgi:hypothetical protein